MLRPVPSLTRSLSGLALSFFILFFLLLLQRVAGRNLRLVVVIYRNGDRNPVDSFPSNAYPQNIWPQGYGQLSKEGMMQQYKLGQYLRNRYRNLLSPEFKGWQIYVRSIDSSPYIMSAQTNLAGLFPPAGEQIWNDHIAWQPVPVHTVPLYDDRLLRYPKFYCLQFYNLLKETLRSRAFKLKLKKYKPLLTQITSEARYDRRTLLDMNNRVLWNIYDTLFIQRLYNLSNPAWVTPETLDKMKSLLELSLSAIFGEPRRIEKSQWQGGHLVKAILKEITRTVNMEDPKRMMMYSADDATLIALHSALNVYDNKLPPYAACHMLELYQETNGQHTIEMYYRTDVAKDPTPLTLPGCSHACPLDKFKLLVAPVTLYDWEAECKKT